MAQFNLQDYEPVDERIKKFYNEHKDGRILTEIYHYDDNKVVIKALIFKNMTDGVSATGYAEEVRGKGMANQTSHVENCETSAIGRALANLGYSGDKRASREEMDKVHRHSSLTTSPNATSDHSCVECGDAINQAVYAFSTKKYGRALCMKHQGGTP